MAFWTLDVETDVTPGLLTRSYRATSGLRLIAAQDRRAPVIAFQTWYGVGSRDEAKGHTGMAHLFEHLMFGQCEGLPAGEFDRLVEGIGGESNAATWVDWTFYRLSLPARDLELAARLESTRMARLTLDPAAVEAERDVVTNERRERVEDDIDGWLDEQLMALAFTQHPYHWPTIGWMEDIRTIPMDAIRAFYKTWYAPNNAALIVVGDFEWDQLLSTLTRYYADIPPADIPARNPTVEPPQDAERRLEDEKPIATDRILLGYKAPGQADADWAVLDVIATLLGGSPSARLYRRFVVERELCSSFDAQLTPFRDPSLMRLSMTCTREHNADEVLRELDVAIAEFIANPPGEQEVAKARNLVETDFWTMFVDTDGKAETLGHFQTTLGDFRQLRELAARFAQVSAEDVRRVAAQLLVPSQRSIVIARAGAEEGAE